MRRIEMPTRGEGSRKQRRKLLRAGPNAQRGRLARRAPHATRSPLPVRICFVTVRRFAKAATLLRRRHRSRFQKRSRNVLLSHRRREKKKGVVNRLADSRTELFQPLLGMIPMHDAADESKLGCNVAAVPADVISCCRGIAPHEFPASVTTDSTIICGVKFIIGLPYRKTANIRPKRYPLDFQAETARS